ncbi:MAG: hypothetical protein JEY99_07440 [Spirochaetales bacterium]|nr:hypothetical protein [Spirochaetales bacterium]
MNKKILLIIIILFISFSGFAQNLEERYLSQANQEYLKKNYNEAYLYINFVLNLYEGEELPLPARILGEKIYFFHITDLIETEKFEDMDEIIARLEQFPVISSFRVKEATAEYKQLRLDKEEANRAEEERLLREEQERIRIEQINQALEVERSEQARLAAIRAEERRLYEEKEQAYQAQLESARQAEIERNEAQQEALREDMNSAQALEIQRSQQFQAERAAYEQRMMELMESRDEIAANQQKEFSEILQSSIVKQDNIASSGEKMSLYVILLIAVIGLFLFIGFGLLIFISIRNSQQSQRQFENTLYTMQNTRPITSINNQFALPDVAETMEHLQLEDPSRRAALPSPDGDGEKFKEMLATCKKYGEQIDQATNRKNNSRNISELVFKISKEMGYDEKTCITHFAVAMVYDIGFLSIDADILSKEQINEEEFDIIKNHVNLGLNMIFFVEKEYQPLFKDGIMKHHENLDGTGYPSGLRDTDIPYIARVIHVVESFVSLISSRNYKSIQDRESAISSLMEETEKYDSKILEALNEIA